MDPSCSSLQDCGGSGESHYRHRKSAVSVVGPFLSEIPYRSAVSPFHEEPESSVFAHYVKDIWKERDLTAIKCFTKGQRYGAKPLRFCFRQMIRQKPDHRFAEDGPLALRELGPNILLPEAIQGFYYRNLTSHASTLVCWLLVPPRHVGFQSGNPGLFLDAAGNNSPFGFQTERNRVG